VQHKLFQSYCTNYYGFELWLLNNPKLEDLCVAWRKSMWKIWKLPQQAHCFLSRLVSGCLPVFDKLCQWSMSFVHSCLSHDSHFIRFVANYAVVHARSQSFLGHNVLFCAHQYHFSVNSCYRLSSFDNLVKSFVHNSIDDNMHYNLLYELIVIIIRERRLYLNDSVLLTGDVNDIIHYVCTS